VADPVNRDARAVLMQALEILTQHIYVMVDTGENNSKDLTERGFAYLASVGRARSRDKVLTRLTPQEKET
jgi:hypothetical protein